MATTPTIESRSGEKTPRRVARHRVESLIYLDLGPDNGGFPINLSEEGMDFQGVRALQKDQELSIALKLNAIEEPITAKARIVWLSETRKAGGLQFIDLPDAARQRIRDWIAHEEQMELDRRNALAKVSLRTAKDLTSAFANSSPAATVTPKIPTVAAIAKPLPDPPVIAAVEAPVEAAVKSAVKAPQPASATESGSESKRKVAKASTSQLPPKSASRIQTPAKKILPATYESKRARFSGYRIGMAASILALAVGAALLWPYRENLLSRFGSLNPATSSAETAAATAAASPAQPPPVPEPSSGPTMGSNTNSTAIEADQEILPLRPLPNFMSSALTRGAGNSAPKAAQANRPANVSVRSKVDAPPAKSAIEPAKIELAKINPATSNPATIRPQAAATFTPAPSTLATPTVAPVAPANSTPVAVNPAPTPEGVPVKIATPGPAPQPASVTPTGSVEIIPDPYPSIRMPAEQGASPTRAETSLQLGRLASRIEPVYPPDALQNRIVGTVTVHAVIGRNGAVQSAEIVSGPAQLADAALRAIQQWRYEPTKLGGTPIEVEEEIKLVFRVGSSPTAAK
jgi:periplasmic protein TonB